MPKSKSLFSPQNTLSRNIAKQLEVRMSFATREYDALEWVGKIEAGAVHDHSPRFFLVKLEGIAMLVPWTHVLENARKARWAMLPQVFIT